MGKADVLAEVMLWLMTIGIVAAIGGASVIRVHDVREAKESILYLEALKSNGTV